MSNPDIFQEKTPFPPFPGRVDKECKLILDAMMGFPAGTMMNTVVQSIFTQLDSGALTGIVLSKNFHVLEKLGAVAPANLKSSGVLDDDKIAAESVNMSAYKKYILINSAHFRGHKNAVAKYAPGNRDWRAVMAHEMTHIINDCNLFFPAAKPADSTYFVEFTEAFKRSREHGKNIWQQFVAVCGELASRFTSWYIWEELFAKKTSDIVLPQPSLFFHRTFYEVYGRLASRERKNEHEAYIPTAYDPYLYLRFFMDKWDYEVLDVKLLTQVCAFMEQTGLHCRFFDDNLDSGIQVNKLFLDAASMFRKDMRLFSRTVLQLSKDGNGLH